MLGKLVLPEIRELIELGDDDTLRDVVNRWHPADLGHVVSQLSPAEQLRVMRLLEPQLAAETFEYLDLETQLAVLESISEQESATILNAMAPDDRTALLAELSPDQSERLLALLNPDQREIARRLLTYGENSVGRLMTPDFVSVRKEWTLRHVLDHVRAHGRDSETLNVIYVVDADNCLIDDLRIREILLAPLHALVSDICDNRFVSLNATDDKKEAVKVFRQYDRTVLPVIDSHGRLVGIVTLDDVLDVAEEEATREIQKFGGLEALDEPYMSTPLLEMVRKRATWLVILFVGEMLTATAMGYFEHEISRAVVLALFVPLIISSGGNSGSQAATLIIRALALGEVKLRDWWLRDAPGGPLRAAPGTHSGLDRLPQDRALERLLEPLWRALDAGGPDRFLLAPGNRALGHDHRLDASVHPQAAGYGPGHVLRAVRRNPGRRDRTDHLFQRCTGHPPRHLALNPGVPGHRRRFRAVLGR